MDYFALDVMIMSALLIAGTYSLGKDNENRVNEKLEEAEREIQRLRNKIEAKEIK